jgi:hypothetical protein
MPESPVKKPSWDAWTAGKSIGTVLLLLPVLAVVATVAQVLEALYYAALLLFYTVTSPYWISRTVWRALRRPSTPERAAQRTEARSVIRGVLSCLGILVGVRAVLAALLVGVVLIAES